MHRLRDLPCDNEHVDNLCHTLAGAALGEAGLKRTTRFGSATLMIASNLPDVDVLVFATDMPSVAFRRGWTHGLLAQALLPVVLAATVFWLGRSRGARFRPLLWLACVGVLSHVFLDLLNNYGVRLLMPLDGRWFYGDSVFIIDVWLWLMFGAGTWLAWTRDDVRPARMALLVAAVYVGALVVSGRAARDVVVEEWRLRHGGDPRALMVGPIPITPFRRAVIVDAGDTYATGTFSWLPREVRFDRDSVPKNDDHPSVRAALAADRRMRAVLTWTRFPYYAVESSPAGDLVTLRDLRFGDRVGAVRAAVAASPGSSRPADRSR
jgi:inner membrane protein